ncbi:MAG: HesA/MoeB/ThiF family protein [Thalassovita sp.]
MGSLIILAAALWGAGLYFGWSLAKRASLVVGVLGSLTGTQVMLSLEHPLRFLSDDALKFWLLLCGFGALALVYALGLRWLKARVVSDDAEGATPKQAGTFGESELARYMRHIVLREIGGPGQKKLKQSKVLVIGAGGLGSPALMYLAASGVGTIGIIDDDVVDNSNLQRQVIHTDARIGMHKVFSAQMALEAQNPYLEVRPYQRRLEAAQAEALFADYDLILDGTDNFETRYLSNRVAAKLGKPLISGALSQWEGQLSVFDTKQGSPCYQCIFPEAPAAGLAPSCAEAGVISPLPGVVGSMMAVEALKVLCDVGAPLRGEMLIYDALWSETRKIKLKKRETCPVCGDQ